MTDATLSSISAILQAAGLTHFGLSKLTRPLTMSFYEEWLKKGFHGEMRYLAEHSEKKAQPRRLMPQAQSAIVVSESYAPHPAPSLQPTPSLRVAQYAKGKDYHEWFHAKLKEACRQLSEKFNNEIFLPMTDSQPVLERDLAARASLGWFGKNTCLIHAKRGSLFFIGEIYTTLDLSSQAEPHPDQCGHCRRCIDVCPTQAIVAPRELDARRCISYLTIESKSVPPIELRAQIGDWFFGCDLCQTVCPWNEKVLSRDWMKSLTQPPPPPRDEVLRDLRLILNSSNHELMRLFANSPLSRAGGRGLKRNAIIVAANANLFELSTDLEKVRNLHPELEELATWALSQFKRSSSGQPS